MGGEVKISGPDFKNGISTESIKSGEKVLGHVEDQPVLMVKEGEQFYAVSASCTHYGANLNDGIIVDGIIRCPWHHACFDYKTGEATKAPALNPLQAWKTEIKDGKVFVSGKKENLKSKSLGPSKEHFVIIGSGAAGHAAAEMLRRKGFEGRVSLISEDKDIPYDRPNLSKDYLAGTAPEEWMPLRGEDFFKEQKIELRLNTKVTELNPKNKTITLGNGEVIQYDKCLLATGGRPVIPTIPGIDKKSVHFLRSFDDCRKLISSLKEAKEVIIVGAGFIGLEAASALKARGLNVTVVAPGDYPLENVVGHDVGAFLKSLHEKNGVRFKLTHTVREIEDKGVVLENGEKLFADVILVATGITPNTELAEKAQIKCENGVLVNEFLETSEKGIFAAGDLARWPDPHSSEKIRVEHWVVAQRQGQTAAKNMLGMKKVYDDVPFFWTQQFETSIRYVGHAQPRSKNEVIGYLQEKNCAVIYGEAGKTSAVLTIGRDKQNLLAESAMEKG